MDKIHVIKTGIFKVNTIIVTLQNKYCFVVDPASCELSDDANTITDYLSLKKLKCIGIILTHSHFDHVTGILPLKQKFPDAEIAIHRNEFDEFTNPPGPMGTSVIIFFGMSELLTEVSKQPSAEISLDDNSTLYDAFSVNSKIPQNVLEELKNWTVIHTPGHTPGSICLYSAKEKVLISGDTLFAYGGYGRTDMAGGDDNLIYQSLDKINKIIPKGTIVYPGHDEFGFSI